ncbi:hypothetical protein V8E53_013391 [Lactarius tabidus]
MAPVLKYLCPCFKCKASGAHQDTLSFVEGCHHEIMQFLHSIDEEFDSGSSYLADPTSDPYPDADAHYQHDPADAPYPDADAYIDSPPPPEGVDSDTMMVDDDCK